MGYTVQVKDGFISLIKDWFKCPDCGFGHSAHDYEHKLQKSILGFILRNHLSVERRLKNRSELPTLAGVMTCEATIPSG